MDIYHQVLQQYWGYSEFRLLQEDIIQSISEGRDTLGLMPTGGGKSITFQVPTMVMEGVCLVITPLIALMKDQVENLKERGIKALAIYSGMSHNEIIITLDNTIMGDYKFLYVSPERLSTTLFQTKLKSMNICMIAVDESHCISQWGYDFRPSYMSIADIRTNLPNIPILALTATATPEVVDDIQSILQFKEKNVFRKSFARKNLAYIVKEADNKIEILVKILNKIDGSTIVYVRSRQKTKEIAEELKKYGISADYFHAGLNHEEKNQKQKAWKNNDCRVIVSTNAFGMGIDKPDVRLVIHVDLPNSLEEYYQEAGRAGRDEQLSYAIILYSKADITKLKKRIHDEFPDRDYIKKVYELLAYFFQIAEGFGLDQSHDFDLHRFCKTYKLALNPTHNALKILGLAEYINYIEDPDSRSKILFTIYRDDLYKADFDSDCEQVINTILRLYPGIFADYTYINERSVGVLINKTPKEVYETLKYLKKRNILDYIPYKKSPSIIYSKPRIPIKYVVIPKNVLELRKERFEKRIKGMIEYVEDDNICRSRILLHYFGENDSTDCGSCDICRNKNKAKLNSTNFDNIETDISNILIKADHTIEKLIELLENKYDRKNILDVIRFNLDGGKYLLCENIIRLSVRYKN